LTVENETNAATEQVGVGSHKFLFNVVLLFLNL